MIDNKIFQSFEIVVIIDIFQLNLNIGRADRSDRDLVPELLPCRKCYFLAFFIQLKIISVPGEALCKECSAMYNVMRNEGRCPKCGSRSKMILGGQEFRIKEIGFIEEQLAQR